MVEEKTETSVAKNLRNDFFYGLIVLLPLIATIFLVKFSIDIFSGPLNAILPPNIPAFINFLISISIITLVGLAARNIIGKAVLDFFQRSISKIPFINTIYKSSTQLVNAFSFKNKNFLSAVLVEYPRKGTWALAFLTRNEINGLIDSEGNELGEGKCSVFIPTTPNPTSGFFLFLDKEEVIELGISVEDSIKVLMSAGVLSPSTRRNLMKTAKSKNSSKPA